MADWPKEACWILEDGWAADWSANKIREELRAQCGMTLSKRAVINKARRMGLPRRSSVQFIPSSTVAHVARVIIRPEPRTTFDNAVEFMTRDAGCVFPTGGSRFNPKTERIEMLVCNDPVSKYGGTYCDKCAALTHKFWPPRKNRIPDTPSPFG